MKHVYCQSIVSVPDYYKSTTLLSYKMHISQNEIDKLPYYVYNNMLEYLKEIVENENGNQKSEGFDNMQSNMNSQMRNMQNSMKGNFSHSGMKIPKFK